MLTAQAESDEDVANWADLGALPNMGDDGIRKHIRRALARNPNIERMHIFIKVANGIVQLSGSVPSVVEKHLAEEVAISAPGVKEVFNSIRVMMASNESNVRMKGEILRCLSVYLGLDLSRVSVRLQNRVAFLSGTVGSERLKSAAGELITTIPFVAQVVNGLTVSQNKYAKQRAARC
jgi:osmotically-inducible protein OsmY